LVKLLGLRTSRSPISITPREGFAEEDGLRLGINQTQNAPTRSRHVLDETFSAVPIDHFLSHVHVLVREIIEPSRGRLASLGQSAFCLTASIRGETCRAPNTP
jgi:hypothetical protein